MIDLMDCSDQHFLTRAVNYSPKAIDFYNATNHARQLLWLGGKRTLKTSSVVNLCAMFATGDYPQAYTGYRYSRPTVGMVGTVKAGKTRDVLQRYFLEGDPILGMLPFIHPRSIVGSIGGRNRGLDWLHVKHVSGGVSRIKFMSFGEGASALQSDRFDYVLLDESAKFDVYQEALGRTMAMDSEKTFVFCTMWPEHGRDETVDFFMNKGSAGEFVDNHYYQHSSWANNPFITEEEKIRIRQGTPAYMIDAVESGIPIFGVGKVFRFSEDDIVIKPFPIPPHFKLFFGIDPAVTHGGWWGACVFAYDQEKDVVYLIKDYKLQNIGWSEHYDNILFTVPHGSKGVCDPAGNGEDRVTLERTYDFLKRRFNKDGFFLEKAKKGDFAKEPIIGQIHTRVSSKKFFVFDTCVNWREEFRRYARDDKSRIIKENDHAIDASFYALHFIENTALYLREYKSLNAVERFRKEPAELGWF